MDQVSPAAASNLTAPAVVLDTNTVLDWRVFRDPGVLSVAAAIETGAVRWIACPRMRDELAHVLNRPSWATRGVDAQAVLAAFDAICHLVPTPFSQPLLRCRDADDQVFLDLAIASRARWLLTRDKALLALARRARERHRLAVIPASHWTPDAGS